MIAPWRIERFRELFPGRTEMIAFCQEKGDPGEGVGRETVQFG
ncbi:MAG: hypothetical protein Ct9H300mP1_01140 [Planctomycetaceae bacterium]|nr:MAG: hypothetical protein Ct9H300mP1_01140 [Planctomycetaceae bacterium]